MTKLREDKISRDATHAERLKWEAELTKQLEILRRDLSARLQKVRRHKCPFYSFENILGA